MLLSLDHRIVKSRVIVDCIRYTAHKTNIFSAKENIGRVIMYTLSLQYSRRVNVCSEHHGASFSCV